MMFLLRMDVSFVVHVYHKSLFISSQSRPNSIYVLIETLDDLEENSGEIYQDYHWFFFATIWLVWTTRAR